ncbi:hypothetical protein QFC22_002779 [Naganishia vaughanmartiniae]|uniref:Uncharacterized protein n=1 Tax=Naganishia vaughanmartiniae TaxID=1424756 RepID=A0ACC2XB73_9TREE|nr:hypothetical protein QFC22_002779 [Naganishia vaughanmartiniae]
MNTVTTPLPAHQDLRQRYDALLPKYKSADEERQAVTTELEMTRIDASDHKQYYGRWQATQAELDDLKKRMEALLADEERSSERSMKAFEAMHQQTVKDKETIRAQKAELELLKGNKGSKASRLDRFGDIKASARVVNKENRLEEGGIAEATRTAEKRKFDDVFNDPIDVSAVVNVAKNTSPLTDLEAQVGPGDAKRYPLSQTSAHNSPASKRMRKANPRNAEDTALLHSHRDVTSRILAQESQSASQDKETEETVPLDFGDETEPTEGSHRPQPIRRPVINLHDKTISRPLVSPETETEPLIIAKASPDKHIPAKKAFARGFAPNLHDQTTSRLLVSPETETEGYFNRLPGKSETPAEEGDVNDQKPRPEELDHMQSDAAKLGKGSAADSKRPNSDRTLRSSQKTGPSPIKTEPRSVKHETPVATLKRRVKQETPLRSEGPSRSATPGTSTKDRPLLPIPGWKGGNKSARAFVRKDSFEDDDFGEQASNRGNTLSRKRELSTQSNTPVRRMDSADPSDRSRTTAQKAKHSAIPGYMSTEMKRSRTTGDTTPARGSTNVRSSPAPERVDVKMHLDPVHERSATTPFRDRDWNVGLAPSGPSPSLTSEGKKHERKVSTSRLREGNDPELGVLWDAGEGGNARPSTSKNAEGERYEINPDRNHGLTYAYQNVERRKEERKKMAGHGCIECENYYNAVGDMPVPKRGPVWRSPSPESKRQESRRAGKCPHGKDVDGDFDTGDDEMEGEEAKQRHMNQISRHRDDWKGPTTPPKFWQVTFFFPEHGRRIILIHIGWLPFLSRYRDIRFPNTQDVKEINEQAELQRQAKRAEMKREAEKKDGKYRRVGG